MASHPRWPEVGGSAAEVYERQSVPALLAPWAPQLVELAGVQPGERILDVACGTGVVARLAAERTGSAGRVVGLDINPAMLAVARSLPPVAGAPIDWVEASVLAMPFPDASFDVVLCQQGLQQFPGRPAALREMRRVLVPGGRVALSVWGRIEANPGFAALAEALERHVGSEAANNRRAPFASLMPPRCKVSSAPPGSATSGLRRRWNGLAFRLQRDSSPRNWPGPRSPP
jgi:SAM-dependent methyltransferase